MRKLLNRIVRLPIDSVRAVLGLVLITGLWAGAADARMTTQPIGAPLSSYEFAAGLLGLAILAIRRARTRTKSHSLSSRRVLERKRLHRRRTTTRRFAQVRRKFAPLRRFRRASRISQSRASR